MFWLFSIYLEAVAILPQLILLQRRGMQNMLYYVVLLGAYRALYILNWVYRAHYEPMYTHNWIVYVCGAVQVYLYLDFFCCYYCTDSDRPLELKAEVNMS